MSGMIAVIAAAAQIAAVPASSAALPSAPCRIIDARHGQGTPDVYAACASSSVRLGPADLFSSSLNLASGKALVIRQNAFRTDAVLVSQDASGAPVIQDVSRYVAHAAAVAGLPRGARPAVNLARFAITGAFMLTSNGSALGAPTKTVTIDLTNRLSSGS